MKSQILKRRQRYKSSSDSSLSDVESATWSFVRPQRPDATPRSVSDKLPPTSTPRVVNGPQFLLSQTLSPVKKVPPQQPFNLPKEKKTKNYREETFDNLFKQPSLGDATSLLVVNRRDKASVQPQLFDDVERTRHYAGGNIRPKFVPEQDSEIVEERSRLSSQKVDSKKFKIDDVLVEKKVSPQTRIPSKRFHPSPAKQGDPSHRKSPAEIHNESVGKGKENTSKKKLDKTSENVTEQITPSNSQELNAVNSNGSKHESANTRGESCPEEKNIVHSVHEVGRDLKEAKHCPASASHTNGRHCSDSGSQSSQGNRTTDVSVCQCESECSKQSPKESSGSKTGSDASQITVVGQHDCSTGTSVPSSKYESKSKNAQTRQEPHVLIERLHTNGASETCEGQHSNRNSDEGQHSCAQKSIVPARTNTSIRKSPQLSKSTVSDTCASAFKHKESVRNEELFPSNTVGMEEVSRLDKELQKLNEISIKVASFKAHEEAGEGQGKLNIEGKREEKERQEEQERRKEQKRRKEPDRREEQETLKEQKKRKNEERREEQKKLQEAERGEQMKSKEQERQKDQTRKGQEIREQVKPKEQERQKDKEKRDQERQEEERQKELTRRKGQERREQERREQERREQERREQERREQERREQERREQERREQERQEEERQKKLTRRKGQERRGQMKPKEQEGQNDKEKREQERRDEQETQKEQVRVEKVVSKECVPSGLRLVSSMDGNESDGVVRKAGTNDTYKEGGCSEAASFRNRDDHSSPEVALPTFPSQKGKGSNDAVQVQLVRPILRTVVDLSESDESIETQPLKKKRTSKAPRRKSESHVDRNSGQRSSRIRKKDDIPVSKENRSQETSPRKHHTPERRSSRQRRPPRAYWLKRDMNKSEPVPMPNYCELTLGETLRYDFSSDENDVFEPAAAKRKRTASVNRRIDRNPKQVRRIVPSTTQKRRGSSGKLLSPSEGNTHDDVRHNLSPQDFPRSSTDRVPGEVICSYAAEVTLRNKNAGHVNETDKVKIGTLFSTRNISGTMVVLEPGSESGLTVDIFSHHVFSILEGSVDILANKETFVFKAGDTCFVPSGSKYNIFNKGSSTAKLHNFEVGV